VVKFLIIRFSSIGDIVLTTPVVRCLKNQVDGAVIHYLTKEQFSGIPGPSPYIDRLWLYKNNMKELLIQLKKEEFDYIIDLHHNIRTLRIKNKLRKISFSFNKLNLQKWLFVNFKVNKLPDVHIVDRYLDTLKVFDVKNDLKGLDYFLPKEEPDLPDSFLEGIPEKYIALVIGAQHETKKVPPVILSNICDKINFPILILGGKDDRSNAELILSQIRLNKNVLDATGKCSLSQSALLVKNAALVITHDTGLMHIAAAFKKKIISIWGNTIPEFGMYPYFPDPESKIFEVKNLRCRPCSKIGFQSCPRKHFKCMKDQNSDEIAFWAKKLIEKLPV
jgi:ADP-heptose:LPS heptosyltransferase